MHPIFSARLIKGKFHTLYENLREHPTKFFIFYFSYECVYFGRVSGNSWTSYKLPKQELRFCSPPEEKIAVTIYLTKLEYIILLYILKG